MIRILTTLILILLSNSTPLPEIDPVALQIITQTYPQVLIYIFDTNDQQGLYQFQQISKQINQTYPEDKTLYAICNASKDLSGKLDKYGGPGVKLINKIVHYETTKEKIPHLFRFYSSHTRPPLPLILKQQLPQIKAPVMVILNYNNETMRNEFMKIYHKLFPYLSLFKISAYALETEMNEKASINIRKGEKIEFYQNELNDIVSIVEFINVESLDAVTQLTDKNFQRIYGSHIDKQILLVYENETGLDTIRSQFRKAAELNINEDLKLHRVLFAQAPMRLIRQYFEQGTIVLQNQTYKIVMTQTDFKTFQIRRFIFRNEVNFTNIINFVHEVQMKQVKPEYKSESIPQTQGEIIKIVGQTFIREIFQKKDQSILVMFIDSKDPKSYQKMQKEVMSFAQKYKQVLKDKLTVGIFDLAKNEHQLLSIRQAPELVLFQKTNKKKPKLFRGQLIIDNLRAWINYQMKDLTIPDNYGQAELSLGPAQL